MTIRDLEQDELELVAGGIRIPDHLIGTEILARADDIANGIEMGGGSLSIGGLPPFSTRSNARVISSPSRIRNRDEFNLY